MKRFIILISFLSPHWLFGQASLSSFNEPPIQRAFALLADEGNPNNNQYLLPNHELLNPDEFLNSPIGQPQGNFSEMAEISNNGLLSVCKPSVDLLHELWGGALRQQPEMHFYKKQLVRTRIFLHSAEKNERKEVLKAMKSRLGKPAARSWNSGEERYTEYTWKGYKLAVQLLVCDRKGEREQVIDIEDILLMQACEAERQNRKLVKKVNLYSDVESLFR